MAAPPDARTLDQRPARQLTSREATKLLCSLVGTLVDMAGRDNARTALAWTGEHFEVIANDAEAWSAAAIESQRRAKQGANGNDPPRDR